MTRGRGDTATRRHGELSTENCQQTINSESQRLRHRLTACLVVAVVAALPIGVYWGALHAGFFSDDYTWLGRMEPTLLKPVYVFSIFYRDFNPMLHASFVLDYVAGGGGPVAFHITSLAIHAASSALLAALLLRMGIGLWTAAAATLLWALNVRISECVIWPSARGHSLVTLFVLAGMLCLLGTRRWRIWGTAAMFLLGLLSKELAFPPMLVLPLIVWMRRRRAGAGSCSYSDLVPTGVLAAIFITSEALLVPPAYAHKSLGDLALKAPFVLLRPIGLGDMYTFTFASLGLFLAVMIGALLLLRRTTALIGFAWLLLCSVPIIPLEKLSSRYLYLLSIGYVFVLCGLVEWVRSRPGSAVFRRFAAVGAVTIAVLLLAANGVWTQREIDDYTALSEPYARCAQILRVPALELAPAETLVIVDVSRRDDAAAMMALVKSRGTIAKLIPYREHAVGGLIVLRDAVNIARRGSGGLLAAPVDLAEPGPLRVYAYDGHAVYKLEALPLAPADRVFAVRLGPPSAYFANPGRI
ncbi:MAG: hypothetical protein AB1714_12815 [Acidobacteriota bacterium]